MEKKCIDCGIALPGDNVRNQKRCKDCAKIHDKEYGKIYRRKYKEKNQEKNREYKKNYRMKHREELIQKQREYRKRPEVIEREKEYKKTEKYRVNKKMQKHRRRAMKKMANGNFSITDFRKIIGIYSSCVYCGNINRLTLDHVIPLNKGGQNDIHNMVLSCHYCNSSKGWKTLESWFKNNPKKKEHFHKIVKEQVIFDRKTRKKRTIYLPRTRRNGSKS